METKSNQFVIFKIGRENYALNTTFVVRIEKDKPVRNVPNSKEHVRGIITVEEDIVTLIDLRSKFNIESENLDKIPYIIVCKIGEEKENELVVGFIVDEVIEVKDIPEDIELGNINELITGTNTDYILGIYRPKKEKETNEKNRDDLIILLNINKLLGLELANEIKPFTTPNEEM